MRVQLPRCLEHRGLGYRAELAAQETITNMPLAGKAAFMISVIILVIQTKSSGIQPFIYFQF